MVIYGIPLPLGVIVTDSNIRIDIHIYRKSGFKAYSWISQVIGLFGQQSQTGLVVPDENKLIPEKIPKTVKGRQERLRVWREKIRADLYNLTGVDIVELASQKITRHLPYNIYAMSCASCGRGWSDGVAISRHHKIPVRLGKALGISSRRLYEPQNIVPLCIKEHLEADMAVRSMVKERHTEMYCWGS